MFKRSRRSTICLVEQLEGRAAASTVVHSAVVFGVLDKVVHLRGHTTNVPAGEHLYIQAAERGIRPSTGIYGYEVAVVQNNGSFFGSIRAERPWRVGDELTVEVSAINPPESIPSTYLLATEHIRITLD
jgi:hypothetical protein